MAFTQEELDTLVAESGERKSSIPKFDIPSVKFNGSTGEFRMDDKGNVTPLDKPLKVVVLKKRSTLNSFTDELSYFTNEFESPNSIISLYKRENERVSFVENESAKVLRAKYPNLKTRGQWYVLVEFGGKQILAKLTVKGKSLGNSFDFQDKMKATKQRSFEYVTSIDVVSGKKGAIKFESMVFNDEPMTLTFDQVRDALNIVRENTHNIDAHFTGKMIADVPTGHVEQKPQEEDVVADEIPEDDSINPEDIPF